MKLYHFARLVRKYVGTFTVTGGGGRYEAGDWVAEPGTAGERGGAVLPLSSRRVLESGGELSSLDRQLIMLEPLAGDLNGVRVEYKGVKYTVAEDRDYSDFSDVHTYLLKAVER